MYLSRVKLEVNNRRLTKELSHLGAYHAWVESSYPQELSSGERSRKLWRIDSIGGDNYLLVLSEMQPDREELEKYAVRGSFQSNNYDKFLENLEENKSYRFRLTANPTISKSIPGQRGRVFPHITVKQQKEYLMERSIKNGFALEEQDFDIVSRDFPTLNHKNSKPVSLSRVTYEGILTITDLELFKNVLIQGLGKKKAYGFGLLTVIPV